MEGQFGATASRTFSESGPVKSRKEGGRNLLREGSEV